MIERIAFDDLNATLKAAGEETRLRILCLLAEAELTVSELTEILRQSQPRISRHLKLLAEAQLVERFREGSWAFFRRAEHGPADFDRRHNFVTSFIYEFPSPWSRGIAGKVRLAELVAPRYSQIL